MKNLQSTIKKTCCVTLLLWFIIPIMSGTYYGAGATRTPFNAGGGFYYDDFTTMANVSTDGSCVIEDGRLTLDALWKDEFTRTSIAPWVELDPRSAATAAIDNDELHLVSGNNNGEWVKAERIVNLRDLSVEFKVKSIEKGNEGPNIQILSNTAHGIDLDYYQPTNELRLKAGVRYGFFALDRTTFNLQDGVWYDVSVDILRDGTINCDWGGTTLSGTYIFDTNISIISLGVDARGEARFDDVVVRRSHISGSAISSSVPIPDGMVWDSVTMTMNVPTGSHIFVDILDGTSTEPIPGFEGLSSPIISLDGIDPIKHRVLVIRVEMILFSFGQPTIDDWNITWRPYVYEWIEPFDDNKGTSLSGDTTVTDGHLTVTNVIFEDDFQRLGLGSWNLESGVSEITDGYLWTGSPASSVTRISHDLTHFSQGLLIMDIMVIELDQGGPVIDLTTSGQETITCDYSHYDGQLRIIHTDTTRTVLVSGPFTMSSGQWYNVQIEYDGAWLKFTLGTMTVQAPKTLQNPFDRITFSNQLYEQTLWNDVRISRPVQSGVAITNPIVPPENQGWINLTIDYTRPLGTTLNVSVIDGVTSEIVLDFENLTDIATMDLSIIDPKAHLSIRLLFRLEGIYFRVPSVDFCIIGFDWVIDYIYQTRNFDEIYLREDEPVKGLLNMTDYFSSKYSPSYELWYNITSISHPGNVLPHLEGFELSIDLPTKDWNGEAYFKVNCSNAVFSIETQSIKVIVQPVDDPPVLADLAVFKAVEDSLSTYDIRPYLSDVDTPVESLGVLVRDGNVTVNGHVFESYFDKGGFNISVTVEVTDATSRVYGTLTIEVQEINDPPEVIGISYQKFIEDEVDTVDLTIYIADEDNTLDELTLICEHHSVQSIEGFNLTVLYTLWEPEHSVSFRVFDGIAYGNGTYKVQVEAAGDPPKILGVGDYLPPIEIEMDESSDLWLPIHVLDEDSTQFKYSISSNWAGFIVFSNGTLRISSSAGEVDVFEALLTVDDMAGGTDSLTVRVTVLNVNDPPSFLLVLHPSNHTQVEEGTNVTYEVDITDPDREFGDILTVTWRSNISGLLRTLTSDGPLNFVSNELPVGDHRITVSATDGEFVREAWFSLTVIEKYVPPPEKPDEPSFLMEPTGIAIIILVILVALVAVVLVFKTRQKEKPEQTRSHDMEPISTEIESDKGTSTPRDLEGLSQELDMMVTTLEEHRSQEIAIQGEPQFAVDALDIPDATAPPMEFEGKVEDKELAEVQEVREVMRAITQLPRGLPSSLSHWDISDLAKAVVNEEKMTTEEGVSLVKIKGTWYLADYRSVGTFLHEWKESNGSSYEMTSAKKKEFLRKLEDRLVNGEISEETYERLRKKYD